MGFGKVQSETHKALLLDDPMSSEWKGPDGKPRAEFVTKAKGYLVELQHVKVRFGPMHDREVCLPNPASSLVVQRM